MRLKAGIVVILLASSLFSLAQVNEFGWPKIVNYPPEVTKGNERKGSEQNWTAVQDQRGILYVGNDDMGVLEYDGGDWNAIPMPDNRIVLSLACAEDGTIYVGSSSEIGYLTPNDSSLLEYKSLNPKLDSTERIFYGVWKIYPVEDKIYFHSRKALHIYYPKLDTFKVFFNEAHTLFGFYEGGKYYNGSFSRGLMVLEGDTALIPAKGGEYFSNKNIYGMTEFSDDELLIGLNYEDEAKAELVIYNPETGEYDNSFGSPEAIDYLSRNYLSNLQTLDNGQLLAATLGGGLCLLDREGNLLEIITQEQTLQSKSVYNIYQNPEAFPSSPVWAPLSLGISRIDFTGPIREFNEDAGYSGLIHGLESFRNRLYIATSTGLYSYTDEFERPFAPVQGISNRIWDIKNFTMSDGKEIMLAVGSEGLFTIDGQQRVKNLKNEVRNVEADTLRIFWGYKIAKDPSKPNRFVIGRPSSLVPITEKNNKWYQEDVIDSLDGEIRSIVIDMSGVAWFGDKIEGLYRVDLDDPNHNISWFTGNRGLEKSGINSLILYKNEVLVGNDLGLFRVYDDQDTVYFYKDSVISKFFPRGNNAIYSMYEDPAGDLWISLDNEYTGYNILCIKSNEDGTLEAISEPFLGLPNFSTDVFFGQDENMTWFSKSNKLYTYNKSIPQKEGNYRALIRKVTVNDSMDIYNGAYYKLRDDGRHVIAMEQNSDLIPRIKHSDNNLRFSFSAPFFDQEENIEYSFYLEGFSDNWSNWSKERFIPFTNLNQGSYTFRVKARNIYMQESLEDSFSFIILRPWYMSFIAFFIYALLIVFVIYVIIALYTRKLKKENLQLEGIIQERTAEIRKQKEELTDSIEYASRIQWALLPPEQLLVNHDLNYFILFKPRDIVSGDFYWFGARDGKLFIVAADCTGHGVPGAFMSMLGISFLDEIVIKSGTTETSQILEALKNHVITSLRQTGKSMEESTKDGMDLAMVSIDEESKHIQFSGAYNPLYAVRELNKEEKKTLAEGKELELDRGAVHNDTHLLYQLKADQMPIGISEKEMQFTSKELDLPGGSIYLFSDGYVDQFGGPSGKKFMSRNFKKLLLDIQHLDMKQQKLKLDETLKSWMGNISQIDDILVIGIRL